MINEKEFQCWKIIKKINEVNVFISFSSGGRIASLASNKIEKNRQKMSQKIFVQEKRSRKILKDFFLEKEIVKIFLKKKSWNYFFPIFQNFFRRKVQIINTKSERYLTFDPKNDNEYWKKVGKFLNYKREQRLEFHKSKNFTNLRILQI